MLDRELGMQRQGQKRASPGPALLSDIQARLGVFLCGPSAPKNQHTVPLLTTGVRT